MKYIIIAILAVACIIIGYIFSLKYSRRASFFKALILLCQKLDVEINYSRERLKVLIEGFDEKTKKALGGLEKNYLNFLSDTSKPLDEQSLFKGITFLKTEEKNVILLFFRSLGRSDLISQSKELKNFETRFKEFSESANLEQKKYGALSFKMGIVSALMAVVLLI